MRDMLKFVLAVAIAGATVAPASAQALLETLAGIKFCRTLKEDTQHLKCFDELLAEKPNAPETSAKPEVEVTWMVDETKSPLDDSPQVMAMLPAINSGNAAIALRCREKKTEVIFRPSHTYLGSEPVKVMVRIDEGKLIETRWSPAANGQAAFAPSAVQFIRALPDN